MLLRCLKAELVKFHRVTGLVGICAAAGLSCHSGNRELPGEYRGPGKRLVQSVEPTHPVFLHVLSAALLSVFCAWQWRLEHTDHNWNSFPHCARAYDRSMPGQIDLGRISIPSGSSVDWGPICPQWKTGRYLRAVALLSCREWLLCGGGGRRDGVCGAALFQPEDPGLRPTGSLRTGGRHRRTNGHRPGLWICLPVLPAVYRDAG